MKPKMPGWVKALLVLGALLFLGVPCLIGVVATVVPRMQEKQLRFACASNLAQLGGLYNVEGSRGRPRSGPALFLGWRKDRSRIRDGEERILLCPGDGAAPPPDTPEARAAYDSVDLEHAPRALCSYAVRDFAKFPLVADADTPLPIAACVHHRRGANVLFDNGSARFMEMEELGLGSDDDLIVGPNSKSPVLQVLRYGDGSVR